MSGGANALLVLASGITGGGAALLGQHAANRAARQRHVAELSQRSEELAASFSLPLVGRRAEALEELFGLVQKTIEDGTMSIDSYGRVRRLLIYAPASLVEPTLGSLAAVLRARRTESHEEMAAAAQRLVAVQQEIRHTAGLTTIERYVSLLDDQHIQASKETSE